jgi:hypothetical protein
MTEVNFQTKFGKQSSNSYEGWEGDEYRTETASHVYVETAAAELLPSYDDRQKHVEDGRDDSEQEPMTLLHLGI